LKNTIKLLATCAILAGSGATIASGTHGGGHEPDSIGKPGVLSKVTRTVNVDMSDAMRYSPASLTVNQGETVRLVVKNSGKLTHELVLGTQKELKEHEIMKKNPEMGDDLKMYIKAEKPARSCSSPKRFARPGHYDAA
jgi:uncharacterized cupredoxin-like copper-binding protein